MTTQTEVLKQALEALETLTQYNMVRDNIFRRFEPTCTGDYVDLREFRDKAKPVITAIKEVLAQPEQEPVAWIEHHKGGDNLNWEEVNHPYAKATPLYTHPPVPTAQPKEPEQEPVAHVLFRQDDDGLEPVMFYPPTTAPDPQTLKDRFILNDVWLSPPKRKPLTDDQVNDLFLNLAKDERTKVFTAQNWFQAGLATAEAAHGITEE